MNSKFYESFPLLLANTSGYTPVKYPTQVIITGSDALRDACKKDHTPAMLKDGYRKDANFIGTKCIVTDYDNGGTQEKDIPPEQWITQEKLSSLFPDVAFYIVTSRNHMKVKHPGEPGERSARPRFHVYFPLKDTITAGDTVKEITAKLGAYTGEMDMQAVALSQSFCGHPTPEVSFHTGNLDITEFLKAHPEIKVPQAQQPEPDKVRTPSSGSFDEEFKRANIQTILNCISADCSEQEWSSVCVALKTAGFSFDVFDIWSAHGKKYLQKNRNGISGSRMARAKWNDKKNAKVPGLDFPWLYRKALEADPSLTDRLVLTGEYKEKHERKQAKRKEPEKEICTAAPEVIDQSTGEITQKEPEKQSEMVINQAVEVTPGQKKDDKKVPSLKVFNADYFNNAEIRQPDPIIDKILFPGLGMLGSPAKMGKSYMMLQLCMSVATGKPFMGFSVNHPGDVLYMDLQGSDARTKKRLQLMGFDPMPNGTDIVYESEKTDTGLMDQLEEWIKSKSNPVLIVIDMLQQVKGTQKRTEDAYQADNRILEPLHDLALKHNLSIFCVMHTRKGNSRIPVDDPYNEIIGSVAQFGTADNAWMILGKRDEEEKRLSVICRDSEEGQMDYGVRFRDHLWTAAGTIEELLKQQEEKSYSMSPVIFTIKKLVEESGGGWSGTMKDLVEETAQKTGQYPASTPEAMKKEVSKFEYRLSVDGIKIKYPGKNGGMYGRRYTFYKPRPEQMTAL